MPPSVPPGVPTHLLYPGTVYLATGNTCTPLRYMSSARATITGCPAGGEPRPARLRRTGETTDAGREMGRIWPRGGRAGAALLSCLSGAMLTACAGAAGTAGGAASAGRCGPGAASADLARAPG